MVPAKIDPAVFRALADRREELAAGLRELSRDRNEAAAGRQIGVRQ